MDYFVLGIGGTGMRCIESLIHLCAMGMFDNTTIHLLALDTDKNNGNFSRLKALKEAYVRTKGLDASKRTPLSDTFFSANIKYYEFSPNYEQRSTFGQVFDYDRTKNRSKEQTDLADLVLTKEVEEFNLLHGYRAQTHLGSMMMYHSIIEAAKSPMPSDLKNFLQTLTQASQSGNPRVFILGSVFGGTGASSIPIIPQALTKAAEIMSNGAANLLSTTYFGSTLLTAYFSFGGPNGTQLAKEKVIATSDKFAMNSQVAMMFYEDDNTVKHTYQRFYMLGTDNQNWQPMAQKDGASADTITGGNAQKNDSHYIELLAACAALDFLNMDDATLKQCKSNGVSDYVFRAIQDGGKLEFKDFVGSRDQEFAKKFGMLLVFSILCNDPSLNFVEETQSGNTKDITGFETMAVDQVNALKDYFRLLHVKEESGGQLSEGWVRQLHRSAGGNENFLFTPKLFSINNLKEMKKFDWNKDIYGDGVGKGWRFNANFVSSAFDQFKKQFKQELTSNPNTTITDPGEQMYKTIYNTLLTLYKI